MLAPFEGGWYRGIVDACNENGAVVAFIDYGNLAVVIHQQLIPLPQQFCDLPAWSVCCRLHAVTPSENEQFNQLAAEQIQVWCSRCCDLQQLIQQHSWLHLVLKE